MKVTRRVDTVTIEVDADTAAKIALVLGNTIDLTDLYGESFAPLVEKMFDAGVRSPASTAALYSLVSKNGYPVIERA